MIYHVQIKLSLLIVCVIAFCTLSVYLNRTLRIESGPFYVIVKYKWGHITRVDLDYEKDGIIDEQWLFDWGHPFNPGGSFNYSLGGSNESPFEGKELRLDTNHSGQWDALIINRGNRSEVHWIIHCSPSEARRLLRSRRLEEVPRVPNVEKIHHNGGNDAPVRFQDKRNG